MRPSDSAQYADRRVLADIRSASRVNDVVLIVAAAVFVGLLAQISIHLSFTPVPITGQTLGVLLSGSALGWRRGAAAMLLYAVAGVVGVPWFAAHSSGYASASFGYVLGFILAAAVVGRLAESSLGKTVAVTTVAMIAGEGVMYACGVTWLAVDLHVGISRAIALGLTPFLIGDAIKATMAALLLPAAWRLVRRAP